MNDFLSNFSGEKYDELLDEKQPQDSVEKKQSRIAKSSTPPLEELVDVDVKIIGKEKGGGSRKGKGEETEIDTTYKKKKLIRYGIIAGSTLVACLTIFAVFYFSNQVTMPNFVDKTFADAKTWAVKNRIELDVEQEFSLEKDDTVVLSQGVDADKGVQKGSVVKMKISKGADQEEKVKLPDFSTMKGTAIEEWLKKNRTDNIKVVKEFSDTIENNTFLRLEFKNSAITPDTYIRKEGATLYISKGKEVFEKNISVPNFSKKMKAEVETWAQTNKIEMTYEESDSDTIDVGQIISQSIPENEKIAKNDKMTVQVSLGKAAVVPWFGSMTKEEALQYTDGGLMVVVREAYSTTVAYGDVVTQSESSGARLTGTEKKVTVTYSVGRPYVEDLTMMKEKDLVAYFYDFKAKGADITYTVHYVSSELPRGSIVNSSKNSEYLSMSDHVDVYVSK